MDPQDYIVDGNAPTMRKLSGNDMSMEGPLLSRYMRSNSGSNLLSVDESLDMSTGSTSAPSSTLSNGTKQFLQSLRGESTSVLIDLISTKIRINPLMVDKVLHLLAVNGCFDENDDDADEAEITESAAEDDSEGGSVPTLQKSTNSSPNLIDTTPRDTISANNDSSGKTEPIRAEKSDVQLFREMMELPGDHPEAVAFERFCASVHATENLMFYRDVQQLKREKSNRARNKMGKQIYSVYVGPGATQPVNLPHRSSELLHARFGPMSISFFKKAEHAVYQNLRSDLWVRYRGRTVAEMPHHHSPIVTRKLRRSNSMTSSPRRGLRSPDFRRKRRSSRSLSSGKDGLSASPSAASSASSSSSSPSSSLLEKEKGADSADSPRSSKFSRAFQKPRRRSVSMSNKSAGGEAADEKGESNASERVLAGGSETTSAARKVSENANKARSRSSSVSEQDGSSHSEHEDGPIPKEKPRSNFKGRMRSGSFSLKLKRSSEKVDE